MQITGDSSQNTQSMSSLLYLELMSGLKAEDIILQPFTLEFNMEQTDTNGFPLEDS
jgi:hypothetical protein